MLSTFSTKCESSKKELLSALWLGRRGWDSVGLGGVGWHLSQNYNILRVRSSYRDASAYPAGYIPCLPIPMPTFKAAGHSSSSLTRNILLGPWDSQKGLILGSPTLNKYCTPLVLHRELHQSAHLCWQRGYGPRPGKHGLMPGWACLSIGTKTQYSSAQTESGLWPGYPVPKSPLQCPWCHPLYVLKSKPPRFSVPSLSPGLLSFAEEGDISSHSPEGTSTGVRKKPETEVMFSHSPSVWRQVCVGLAAITHNLSKWESSPK